MENVLKWTVTAEDECAGSGKANENTLDEAGEEREFGYSAVKKPLKQVQKQPSVNEI